MHLADAFIQSDLVHSGYTFFISMCVPWELNPYLFKIPAALPTLHQYAKIEGVTDFDNLLIWPNLISLNISINFTLQSFRERLDFLKLYISFNILIKTTYAVKSQMIWFLLQKVLKCISLQISGKNILIV